MAVIGMVLTGCLLRDARQASRVASCMNDIKMVHFAFEEYAAAHGGLLPPLSATRGNLMIDPEGFYPEYLPNSCWIQCEWGTARRQGDPHHKNDDLGIAAFNDDSFCYIPWELRSEAEALAFIEAYKTLDLANRHKDLRVTVDGEERVLPRTRHISWNLPEAEYNAQEPVPVFIEWSDHYHDTGVVLLSNGVVVRHDFSEPFPITDAILQGLREIASLDRPPVDQ